jgi:ABC-type glycerol-3-phosphate transport system permease component
MIISNIERRTLRGKFAMTVIYTALFLGAVTMVYPFLLMLRLSTSDKTDQNTLSPLPSFWWNKSELAKKYLTRQYLTSNEMLAYAYGDDSWSSIVNKTDLYERHLQPFESLSPSNLARRAEDFVAFKRTLDPRYTGVQRTHVPGRSQQDMWIQFYLAERDHTSPDNYRFIEPPYPDFKRRDWTPPFDADWFNWQEWSAQLLPEEHYAYSANFPYQVFLKRKYNGNLAKLNAAHGSNYRAFAEGPVFTTTPPSPGTLQRADWDAYVTTSLPLYWQRLTPEAAVRLTPGWRKFLIETKNLKGAGDWAKRTGLPGEDPAQMALAETMPPSDVAARWWCDFVAANAGIEDRTLSSSEEDFHAFLITKYHDLAGLNGAWAANFKSWAEVRLPLAEADLHLLSTQRVAIIWQKTTENYQRVFQLLAGSGGGPFANTFFIIVLSVITSLTVNPLAAYALSRFRLRRTQKALIFILATMALPSEVALVPGFLLVRDLHLTDSFFALVLPHAANAFSIFLLKGFFDSLPQELYEAATIDGAGEIRMFLQITIPLAMPIIAVTLLGTITHAYNLFMPAVMYLGDTSLWPVATKIYEINQTSGKGIGMAALVVASVFPLLVFIFCQRIIMRGIILPSMK